MNAKISVFVICVEAIIYSLLHNLHDCTFNKTLHRIDAWQGSDYFSDSAYTRVLNMPGLH